jgi:hypothetical protein
MIPSTSVQPIFRNQNVKKMNDDWSTYTTNTSNYLVSFTQTTTWTYYPPPSDPSAPPCGVREPRRPLLPSGASSEALSLPEAASEH